MTYGMDPQQASTKKPVHKRWWFWPLILVAAFFAYLLNTPTSTDRPEAAEPAPTETVTVTAAPEPDPTETEEIAPEPDPEPNPEEPPFEISHENELTTVHFEIEDALFKSGIKRNAERQIIEALQAAVEEYPDYQSIRVTGEFLTTDQYGNDDMSNLFDLYYEKATVDKINFDNTHKIKIFDIHDGGKVHPDLRG